MHFPRFEISEIKKETVVVDYVSRFPHFEENTMICDLQMDFFLLMYSFRGSEKFISVKLIPHLVDPKRKNMVEILNIILSYCNFFGVDFRPTRMHSRIWGGAPCRPPQYRPPPCRHPSMQTPSRQTPPDRPPKGDPFPPNADLTVNRMTDSCEKITFPHTSYAVGNDSNKILTRDIDPKISVLDALLISNIFLNCHILHTFFIRISVFERVNNLRSVKLKLISQNYPFKIKEVKDELHHLDIDFLYLKK